MVSDPTGLSQLHQSSRASKSLEQFRFGRYAKRIVVVNNVVENAGANKLGSSAYKTGSNRYRKVEETEKNK